MPRRFKDHRQQAAREYRTTYQTIAERYPPPDRLGCRITAIAADMLLDYETMRRSKKGTAGARRKTAGLLLGALRAAREATNGHDAPDLAAQLAAMAREEEAP